MEKTNNILIFSDIHFGERRKHSIKDIEKFNILKNIINNHKNFTIILLGDIFNKRFSYKNREKVLNSLFEINKNIIYIAGDHDKNNSIYKNINCINYNKIFKIKNFNFIHGWNSIPNFNYNDTKSTFQNHLNYLIQFKKQLNINSDEYLIFGHGHFAGISAEQKIAVIGTMQLETYNPVDYSYTYGKIINNILFLEKYNFSS